MTHVSAVVAVFAAALLGLSTACASSPPSAAPSTTSTAPGIAAPSPSGSPAPPPSTAPAPARPKTTSPRPAPSGRAPSTPGAPTALVTTTADSGRYVALTFDDGPNPTYTPQILALLERYGVHATFCEIGDAAEDYPGLVREVAADGNRLCDHTMTHDEQLGTRTWEQIYAQITDGKQTLRSISGASVLYYRQPGGNWTAAIQQIAADDGMQNLSWSVDPRDWSMPGTSTIVARVEANLRPGSVLLMHDGDGDVPPGGGDRSESVAALAILLPWMIAQGYHFDFPA
jgi:peptidoglycan/xylan/chitin deacetylase (PgdA/CDA1 family)